MFEDWTIDELKGFRKELSANLVLGARIVQYETRRVEYTSVEQMKAALTLLCDAIDGLAGTGRGRTRQIRVYASKGFC